jgi:hypothetical protein
MVDEEAWRSEGIASPFSISTLDRSEWSGFAPGRFTIGKVPPIRIG